MVEFVDLYSQYRSIKIEIDKAIEDVICDSAFIGGKYVAAFEREFATFVGADSCLGLGNGTDALEIAIEAARLPPGSEIIVPGNSFIATSEAVTRSGHRVVFADVDPGSYTLTADTARAKMTDRTKAIIAVHLYGHPCDMAPLMDLARDKGLVMIEDCAQAHGAEYYGQRVGNFGDFATFSFYPGKNLGAYGDAGALVVRDADNAALARKIANHGRITKYDHEFEGRNSRLDGLQAAILSVKLRHLESWTMRRIEIAERYMADLAEIDGLVLPVRHNWARQVYHLFVIRTAVRDKLKSHLERCGIGTGIHYPISLPMLKAYGYLGPVDETLFVNRTASTLLSLPIGEHMSNADVETVIAAVKEFYVAERAVA